MTTAQESANNEDKSSAGDKYETSRAMGHLERDMNAKQLLMAQQELESLLKLPVASHNTMIIPSSLVSTNHGLYFIGAGLGKLEIDGITVTVLSPKAPMAVALLGHRINDEITFNNRKFEVMDIF